MGRTEAHATVRGQDFSLFTRLGLSKFGVTPQRVDELRCKKAASVGLIALDSSDPATLTTKCNGTKVDPVWTHKPDMEPDVRRKGVTAQVAPPIASESGVGANKRRKRQHRVQPDATKRAGSTPLLKKPRSSSLGGLTTPSVTPGQRQQGRAAGHVLGVQAATVLRDVKRSGGAQGAAAQRWSAVYPSPRPAP